MLVEEEKLTFRVVTIGDSSVGKTCIINRFLRDTFDVDEPNTIGALYDSFVQEYNGRTIEIQLWDTAGQEQYRALGPVYFRSAAAALVVFDLTNRESFNNLMDWIKAFRSVSGENTVLIVIGNKCDLSDRQIQTIEAKEWAKDHDCSYVETSAKTGQGVKVLFDALVTSVAQANFEDGTNHAIRRQMLESNDQNRRSCC